MDPIRTAIMNNRFTAIVEEASTTLHRTAHTTFVKLVQDYQCAIATPDGDIFAYPRLSGVTHVIGVPLQETLAKFDRDDIRPGDVIVTNDPFSSDGMITHLMDITLIRPIFFEGELMGFGWAFVHASDIGGAVPGSISPAFTEVFQEGLRIRPTKLYREGVLVEDIKNIFLDNSRIPDEMWGDFQAMLAAIEGMERRLVQLCERYGKAVVKAGMREVIDFAEAKARSVIARIPDGTYHFSDYLEGLAEGQYTYINTTMTVAGDEVFFDFAGTDPQIPAAYNLTTGARTHPYLVQALVSYILTIEPHTPRNMGILKPIRTNVPRGTVINAVFPAAGGSRVASSARTYDTLIGCLHQAVPEGLAAGGSGMVGIIVVSARDRRTGKNRVSVINTICGGGGGRRGKDGIDGTDVRFGMLQSVPTELIEVETVAMVRAYQLLPDTQAAGRWRGGSAVAMEIENTGHEATVTVRGLNRFHFRPWGADGGEPGRLAKVIADPGTARERSIGKITVLQMKKGDVVRIISSAGGGLGDPLQRDVDAVRADLELGLLTADHAREVYGVVVDADGLPDGEATAALRAAMASTRREAGPFSFGAEREAQDRLWPHTARVALAKGAMEAEVALRHAVLARVCDKVETRGETATLDAVAADLKEARHELGAA